MEWEFSTFAHWDYFVIGWMVDVIRYLIAALKGERIQGNRPKHLSADDALPIVSSNVMLSNGEVCHYCGAATHVKTKNVVVGYTGENTILVICCKECNSSIIFDDPNDIVYLYRLAEETPLLYTKLALKENGLQNYVDAINEIN